MFMLVIGGAFGIVMRTGTVDNGILAIRHQCGATKSCLFGAICPLSLGAPYLAFSAKRRSPFAIIIALLMVRLGHDSITTVPVTYIATQIGFCQFVDEPFRVVVARGIAGVPVLPAPGCVLWSGLSPR